jgi:hypothetical protein
VLPDSSLPTLDKVAADRGKAIERHRGNAGSVGTGRQEIDRIADREIEWQLVGMTAVEDIGTVAGRTGEDHRTTGTSVTRRADAVMDALVESLVEAVVKAGVEVNPTLALVRRFARNKQDLGAQQAGIADQVPAGLDK